MGLDVYFRDDITAALLAADRASATTVAAVGNDVLDPDKVHAFRQGFRAALATVAIAFGIEARDSAARYAPGDVPTPWPACADREGGRL